MPRPGPVAQVVALFVLGSVLVAGGALASSEPAALLAGAIGVALCAWGLAHRTGVLSRAATSAGPAVAVRALRRARLRAATPRHLDPDAPGHTRARAPAVPHPVG